MTSCDHIIGYEEGVDEAWLCRASGGFSHSSEEYDDIRFKVCPLCGDWL